MGRQEKVVRNLFNNKGFSLTEALISSALLGAVFLTVLMGVEKINTNQSHNAQLQSSELIKNSLYSILNNPKAWENTLSDPSNAVFNCLSTTSGCNGHSGHINVVRQSNNSLYFKADGDSGFRANGKVCKKSVDGSSCFLSTKLKVSFLCDTDCKSPLAQIDGSFYFFNSSSASLGSGAGSYLNFQMLKALKSDDCALGCRTETITPSLESTLPTITSGLKTSDLKVVMVVDNSSSMKNAQEFLSNGLGPLMSKIRSLDIKTQFFIYTTTQFYGDGEKNIAERNTYYRYTDNNGVFHETTSSPSYYSSDYDIVATENPVLLPPIGGTNLMIAPGMSDSDFDYISNRVKDLVSDGVGIKGSPEEQGLCSMARTLFDTGTHAPFVTGDNVLFIVLTDENDISEDTCYAKKTKTRKCLDKYNPHGTLKAGLCNQSQRDTCDRVLYKAYSKQEEHLKATRSIKYKCISEYVSDGETLVGTTTDSTYRNYMGRCADEVYGAGICSPEDLQRVYDRPQCNGSNDSFVYCNTTCKEQTTVTKSYVDKDKSTMNKNLFTSSFTTSDGNTYDNLFKYFEVKYPGIEFDQTKTTQYGESRSNACENLPEQRVSFQEVTGLEPDSSTLKDAIKQRADSMFGPDGYSMSLIINDKDLNDKAGCSLTGAQSYGTEYKDLASNLAIPGGVSSICSADYSIALENVSKFAEKVASEMKKTITLKEGERVIQITSTADNGQAFTLSSPKDYKIQGLVVTFTDDFVTNNKNVVEVRIGKAPPELKQLKPKWMTSNY